ncbi:hypothetical protein CCP50_24945 [Salmonella enterica]|nr:hypothetical protein [Salmonella enterica]
MTPPRQTTSRYLPPAPAPRDGGRPSRPAGRGWPVTAPGGGPAGTFSPGPAPPPVYGAAGRRCAAPSTPGGVRPRGWPARPGYTARD